MREKLPPAVREVECFAQRLDIGAAGAPPRLSPIQRVAKKPETPPSGHGHVPDVAAHYAVQWPSHEISPNDGSAWEEEIGPSHGLQGRKTPRELASFLFPAEIRRIMGEQDCGVG